MHRLLQDDGVPSRVRPGSALDPILTILRVAEAMGVGIAFTKSLGWAPDTTTLVLFTGKRAARRAAPRSDPRVVAGPVDPR